MSLGRRHCNDGGMDSFAVVTAGPAPGRTAPGGVAGVCCATARGRTRTGEAALCGPVWFAIADGMGGHRDGHVAGKVALDVLAAQPSPMSADEVGGCVAPVDRAVRAAARHAGAVGMGASLVAATAVSGGVAVVHVGDSRCYRLADGVLTLLTHDHSYVQELVDLGRLTPDEARHHRLRHLVTRALGVDGEAEPDTTFVPGPAGRLLLCSDGIGSELSHRTIGRVLAGFIDPQAAAERLVEMADRSGARDDLMVLVVDDLGGRP